METFRKPFEDVVIKNGDLTIDVLVNFGNVPSQLVQNFFHEAPEFHLEMMAVKIAPRLREVC